MSTLYCPKCSYNLSNLTENRCPECGEAFDPDKVEALQKLGISTRSVVLQLIFVPVGLALLAPICLITSAGAAIAGLLFSGFFLLAIIGLHSLAISQAYVKARRLRDGDENTPWLFRHLWACFLLFAFTEAALTFMYFAGGCAVILMNLNFH